MKIIKVEKTVFKTLKFPELRHKNTWIAGGAIRDIIAGENFNDIDVYACNEEAFQIFHENLINCKVLFNNNIVKTFDFYGQKLQLIKRYFPNPEECLMAFDYTICQFAYDGEFIYFNPESLLHLGRKALVVNNLQKGFEVDSLRRLLKYVKRGYTICNGGLMDLVTAFSKMSESDIKQQTEFYPDGSVKIQRWD